MCLCEHVVLLLCILPRCLSDMRVLRRRVVTLRALLIEAFFSPAWLNSNGLRFDFPQGQGRREQTTHRHTPQQVIREERNMQGGKTHQDHRKHQTLRHNETDRET